MRMKMKIAMLRKILFLLIPLALFQPSKQLITQRISLEQAFTKDQIESIAAIVDSNPALEELNFLTRGITIKFNNKVNDSGLSSSKDLIKNGVYRTAYEWSLFGIVEAQITVSQSPLYYSSNSDDLLTIALIGDSNANGASDTITTCSAGTLYNYNTDLTPGTPYIEEVTTQTVNTEVPAGTLGSFMHPFATEYKALTGRPTYLINGSHGQSCVYSGCTYNWYTSGDLYDDFTAKVTAGLAAANKSSLDGIVINVGINDLRQGHSVANITTGYTSLISRLTTDYPGVPILIIQIGRSETIITNNDYYRVREMIVDLCNANANVHMCGSALFFAPLTSTYYESDALHYSQAMQKFLGPQLARWFTNGAYSKWGRSVISSMFSVPSSGRKTLIDNLVSSQITSSNYFSMDGWHVLKTDHTLNTYIDWTFVGCGFLRSATFVANDAVSTNGTSTYYDTSYNPDHFTARSSVTDIIFGAKVKTRTTTAAASLFGAANAGTTIIFNLLQLTSPSAVLYRSYDATNSSGTDVLVQAGNLYSVGRNGTSKYLYKNSTQQATAIQTGLGSTGAHTFAVGAANIGGTRSGFMAGSYEYVFVAAYSAFDLSNFYTNMETLISGW